MLKENSVGKQWLIDIHGYPDIPKEQSLDALKGAAEAMGSEIVDSWCKEIPNERIAYLLISESHLSLHHYPKWEFKVGPEDYKNGETKGEFKTVNAFLDMFICGDKDLQKGLDYLQEKIGFNKYLICREIQRGCSPLPTDSGDR